MTREGFTLPKTLPALETSFFAATFGGYANREGLCPKANKKKTTYFRKSPFLCGCQDSNLEPFGS